MKSWVQFLSGSVCVYTLMAACSSGSRHGAGVTASTGGNAVAQGGVAGMQMNNGGVAGDGVGVAGSATVSGGSSGQSSGGTTGMMDPIPEADAATSGTRLKARYYVGADGAKQFAGWRDTMRNEDCTFSAAESGMVRCLPVVGAYATFYGDAGCTQPLATVVKQQANCGIAGGPQVPGYVYDYKAYLCGGFQVAKVGAATTPAAIWYVGNTGCMMGTVQSDVYTYYSTTPVDSSMFVAATTQVD